MAKTVTIELDVKTGEAQADIEKLNKSVVKTEDSFDDLSNSADKFTGGAISGFKGVVGGVKKAVTAFKSLRVAVMATGIGALVVAIVSLQQAFTRSEEGQNKFAKLMSMIGAITGALLDRLANLGESIINVFTNPIQSLKDFGASITSFVSDRINNVLEGVGLLGSALQKVFTGDFKGALSDATDGFVNLNKGLNPAVIATTALAKATSNLVKEMTEEAKIAGQIADQRSKADKVDRELLVERAEANRRVAELREQAADKENISLQQRLDAIREAGQIEEDITKKEIAAAKLRLEAKQAENALGLSTKEDLEEEAQLKARLIDLETARLSKQKALTAELTTALREQAAEEKAIQTAKDAADKERQDRLDKEKADREAKEEADKKARDERIAKSEIETEQMRINAKRAAVDQAIALFGAETAAGKAALIAKQVLAAQELINEAKKTLTFSSLVAARSSAAVAEGTAQTAKVGFPQNIPMLIAYALQAVGIVSAVSQAVGKSKGVAASLGAGGGSAPNISAPRTAVGSTPPAFNIVGAGGTSQLAEAIGGQSQEPVRAYVVSNDVSTAQELDRNIVKGASLG
jgi:hypothetical protein